MSKKAKRARRSLINEAPQKLWPDAILHHGVRLLLLLSLSLGTAALFPSGPGVDVGQYQLGAVADQDVIAQVGFQVLKDPQVLAQQREAALAAVPATFVHQPGATDSTLLAVDGFFQRVDSAAAAGGAAGVTGVLSQAGIPGSSNEVQRLAAPESANQLRTLARGSVQDHLPRGVIEAGQAARAGDSIRIVRGGVEAIFARESVLSEREFYDRALEGAQDTEEGELLRKILGRYVESSLVLDAERTTRESNVARTGITNFEANVVQGEAIVRANQQVGPSELAKLESYRSQLRTQGIPVDGSNLRGAVGGIILDTMLFSIFFGLVFLFRPAIYRHFRTVLLIAGLFAVYFVAGRIMDGQGIPPAALPIVFVAVSIAILWDGRLALLTTFVLAAVTVLQEPYGEVNELVLVLVGGAAASLSVRAFRRLSQTWVFIAIIAAAYALAISGLWLRNEEFPWLVNLGAALASTVIGALLAIGFLPIWEWFTKITSDQTLLGWADTNQSLLRRLAMEAPGTYSHTIQVANLAEAGANAIGAKGLLCRVGMYYHDIGKMVKPQYFIENQQGGVNPHDRLDPRTSAAIVRDHVIEGVKLAEKEKVPAAVVDFIREHHGDQSIGFFYKKAVDAAEESGGETPDVGDFSYPGPRPRSRETAIAMLADAVESASRALQNPTEERVHELVRNIVASRVKSGQLNEAPLTLKDLAGLEEQFGKILTGIHHQRLEYPETRHLTAQKEANAETGGEAAPARDGESADEKGEESGPKDPEVDKLMWQDVPAAGNSGEGDES
ncbi:MAG: HD family phosphohydrolase [Longimicrobiales bacterium]